MWQQAPALLLGLIVTGYWLYVIRMVLRVRRDAGRVDRVLVPTQRRERLMWLIWVPVIAGWFSTPIRVALGYPNVAGERFDRFLLPAGVASSTAFLIIRFLAVGVAILCLALSIRTWRHMGDQWRMAVDPNQRLRLLVDGPFQRVRHPIYALSILLMLASVVVLPSATMLFFAIIHITLMHLKAANEERFLLQTQGAAYADYCRRTGRFIPFTRSRPPTHEPRVDPGETSPERPIRGWKDGANYPYHFNMFQQSMLKWDRLHPYNAVHAVRVEGAADADELRAAAWEVAQRAGLGELAVNRHGTAYEYRPLQFVRVQELAAADSVEQRLNDALTEEINAGFPGGMHHPVRWTVFNEAGGQAHWVLLCYHHAISDALGVERLMAATLRRYLGLPATVTDSRLTTRLTHPERSLRIKAGPLNFLRAYLRLGFRHKELRSSHKMPDERYGGDLTAVLVRSAPPDLPARLLAGCKRRGVGINDALIAAFASAIAEQTPDRHTSRRRRRIAMATVVGARRFLPPESADDFGVCLSSILAVLHRPDDPVERLVEDVAKQTRFLKTKPRLAAAETDLRYFAVRWLGALAGPKQDRRYFRRVFPICGGVSTVFVDGERFADLRPHVTRYVRACPPGPVSPLLMGPTFFDGRLELSLTYRIASRTHAEARALLDGVLQRLEQLSDAPAASPRDAETPPAELTAGLRA